MSQWKPIFILTLLLCNTACHAASSSSPMRRSTVSVSADGSLEKQRDSTSELAELLGELPEEAGMVQSLLVLAEGKPADELAAIIKKSKDEIIPWHTNATAWLKNAIEEVQQCTARIHEGVSKSQVTKSECTEKSSSHISDRKDESSKLTNKEHFSVEETEKKEITQEKCEHYKQVKEEVMGTTATYSSGDEEAYLESVCSKFSDLIPRYDDSKEKCTTAKTVHEEVVQKLETATTEYEAQHKAANTIQTDMDITCCKYALETKDACESYDTCYEDKVKAYNDVEAVVKGEEKMKKVLWRVFSRIECLLPILGTSSPDKIEECRKLEHSTAHLDIDYPEVHEKSECAIEAAYPGTEAYSNMHSSALPDNAKGKAIATCTGMGHTEAQPATATCTFTMDNNIDSVYYNGVDITSSVSGSLASWTSKNSATVTLISGAYFVVTGHNFEHGADHCRTGGFSISCDNGVTSSDDGWEAYASNNMIDDTHKQGQGSSWGVPCQSTSGFHLPGFSVGKIFGSASNKYAALRKQLA